MIEGTEEVVSHLAYDSGSPGASGVTLTLFSTPLGGGTTPKTYYSTNMSDSGKFPGTDWFRILSYRVWAAWDKTIANIVALMKGYVVLEIGSKPYLEAPIFVLCGGGGLKINAAASSAGTSEYAQFGNPTQLGVYTLPKPIDIPRGATFNVTFTWPTAPGDLVLWFGMDGELHRPIQ